MSMKAEHSNVQITLNVKLRHVIRQCVGISLRRGVLGINVIFDVIIVVVDDDLRIARRRGKCRLNENKSG